MPELANQQRVKPSRKLASLLLDPQALTAEPCAGPECTCQYTGRRVVGMDTTEELSQGVEHRAHLPIGILHDNQMHRSSHEHRPNDVLVDIWQSSGEEQNEVLQAEAEAHTRQKARRTGRASKPFGSAEDAVIAR